MKKMEMCCRDYKWRCHRNIQSRKLQDNIWVVEATCQIEARGETLSRIQGVWLSETNRLRLQWVIQQDQEELYMMILPILRHINMMFCSIVRHINMILPIGYILSAKWRRWRCVVKIPSGGVIEILNQGSCKIIYGLWRQLSKLTQGERPCLELKGFG